MPDGDLTIDVHVSHHGTADVSGRIRARWVAAGWSFTAAASFPEAAATAESSSLTVAPFALSEVVSVTVPAPGGAARLLLWFTTEDGQVIARSFIDAAPIEAPNRRGARAQS